MWIDEGIESYRNMLKEASKFIAAGFMNTLVKAVEAGEIDTIPSMVNAEGQIVFSAEDVVRLCT